MEHRGTCPLQLSTIVYVIGVGAQSTLEQDIFVRKCMYEKLAKYPKIYIIFVRKIFCPIFFFFWGGANPLIAHLLRLCILCATTLRPLYFLWDWDSSTPSHEILATPLQVTAFFCFIIIEQWRDNDVGLTMDIRYKLRRCRTSTGDVAPSRAL